jgi:hypothetical protein
VLLFFVVFLKQSPLDPFDTQEKSERAQATSRAVQMLAGQMTTRGGVTESRVLDDMEVSTGNLWAEREKDERFIHMEGNSVRCASLNQLVYVCCRLLYASVVFIEHGSFQIQDYGSRCV